MSEITTVPAVVETGLECAQGFETLQRIAKLFAESSLVPQAFQKSLPNCSIALHMALRMKADPLMVMQNLYVVHGRPSWSSQFLIATFNQSGKFSALRYRWSGAPDKDDYGCTAYAVEKATGETLEGATITISLAKKEGWHGKNGSKWQTMPQQMLMYRAAAFFVRAYAPELAMGLPTQDEVTDSEPVTLSGDATRVSKSERLALEMGAKPIVTETTPVAGIVDAAAAEASKADVSTPPKWSGIVPTLKDIADAKNMRRVNQIAAEIAAASAAGALLPDIQETLTDAIVARQNEFASKGGAA